MSKNIKATARIQITVELEAGNWGSTCQIDQVHDQASKEAVERLLQALKKSEIPVRLIGSAKVTAIIVSEP